MSTRPRPVSQLPKPPTSLAPNCVIAEHAVLTGSHLVTIGDNAVLHPRARINSTYGPVTIGPGCIISEKTVVGLQSAPKDSAQADAGIVLERNVVLHPGVTVEATSIGESSSIEAGCKILAGARIGKHCKIAPLTTLALGAEVRDYVVVYGPGRQRQQSIELQSLRESAHEKQIEVLRILIPNHSEKWR